MTAIPTENMTHIRSIAEETLPDYAKPDYRRANRWYSIHLDQNEATHAEKLASRLRATGYKVSVLPDRVKVTKADLHWPEVQDDE